MNLRRLKSFLGITLITPLILLIGIPILEMVSNQSGFSRWLFESILFPPIQWAEGSYIKALILIVVPTALFISWVSAVTWCFLGEPE
jgi:hypothetical protein